MTTLQDRQGPTTYNFPSNFYILGGRGAGADGIITLVWIAFYGASFGLALWRVIKHPVSRHWLVLRVALVAACRIVSNTMRYIEYGSSSSTRKWVVVEQIFLAIGYFLLVDAVLLLLDLILAPSSWLMSWTFRGKQNGPVSWILGLCHLMTIPAVVLGAWTAGWLRSIRSSSPNLALLGRCRLAGAALFLAIGAITVLLALYTKRLRSAMKLRSWLLLVAITVLSTFPAAYMVALYRQIDPPSNSSDGGKAAFYCCYELPIFLVVLLMFGLNLPHEFEFGAGAVAASDDHSKPVRTGEQWAELESARI